MEPQITNLDNNENFTHKEKYVHRHDVIVRAIELIGGFIVSTLAIRFILALLGANPANGFASFIYNLTSPFTAPFYSLFSYDHPAFGASSLEGYTIIAIIVYALATEGLARLVSITRY